MAVALMMVCALGVIVSESEEADAASVYTITFDAPGGDGTNHAEYKFESGTTIQLPVTTFSRTDHMIEYWSDSDGTRFTPGQDWTITRNDTLTAVYKSTRGNHMSSFDLDLDQGVRGTISLGDLQNQTPGGGTVTLSSFSPLRTEVIDGENHVVIDAGTSPGIYYVEWNKAILGISPTYYWCQVRIPSSFDTNPPVSSISISGDTNVNVGETLTYTANVSPSNAGDKAVTWRVVSGSASITSQDDDSCKVRFSGKGTVVLEASADDYSAASSTISINVVQMVTSVTISGSSTLYKEVGDTGTLRATVYPSTASNKNVTWSSSNTSVVTFTGSGTSINYTCKAVGTSTIKCTANDGSGKSDSVTIVVENLVQSVTISGGSPTMEVGESMRLNVTVTPSDADDTSITWSADPSNLIDFTTEGDSYCNFTALAPGTVTIYADANDDSGEYDEYTITIQEPSREFKLAFNVSPGSGGPSQQTWTERASTYTTNVPASYPIRSDGYVFDYWSGSDGKTYHPGDSIVLNPGTTTLTAIWKQNQYTCYLKYDAPGASNVPDNDEYTGPGTSNHTFTIENKTPTKTGSVFLYWSCDGVRYDPRDTIDVPYNGTKTLTAVWDDAQLEITSTQNSVGMIVDEQFSYTVTTSHEGCTVSVSGADWLSVSGSTISGTPTETGPYNITVTIHKDGGYVDGTQSFTITVYSKAGFVSEPGADGFYTYMLD